MVIEQDFPEHYTNEKGEQKKFAGVGIASKLGMDLALMRQKNNPQVIGYYGADSVFDPNWIKDCLDTYKKDKVDSVRGRQKENKHYNKVEDENGLHTLEEDVIEKIWTFEKRRYKYLHQLKIAINNEAVANGKDKKKEAHGAATQTAGMYAHIGGMNIEAGGEDIKNAQTISEAGRIVDSDEGKMCAVAVGRIENPRTEGGSYTQGLWTMYRAFQYGEGNLLDKEGNLLVDDPEDFRDREIALNNSLKSIEKFYHEGKIDETIERYFSSEEIVVLQEAKIKNPDNFDQFLNSITASLKESFWKKFYELHPLKRIRIEDAEKKFGEMQ